MGRDIDVGRDILGGDVFDILSSDAVVGGDRFIIGNVVGHTIFFSLFVVTMLVMIMFLSLVVVFLMVMCFYRDL